MIYPMMINVDFASIKDAGRKPKALCITLVVKLADQTILVSPRFVHLASLRMTLRPPAYRGLFGFAFALPASSQAYLKKAIYNA